MFEAGLDEILRAQALTRNRSWRRWPGLRRRDETPGRHLSHLALKNPLLTISVDNLDGKTLPHFK